MKINKKFFSKIFKYQLSSILISIIVSTSFYLYSINNKKFEIDLIIYVNKHNYDYYNLNLDSYISELKKNIKSNILKNNLKIKKKHKLYIGELRSDRSSIDNIIIKVLIYGINYDNFLTNDYFKKVAQDSQSDFYSKLQKKLFLLKNSSPRLKNSLSEILNNTNDNSKNIEFTLQLDPYVEHDFNKQNEILGIQNILKDKNHITHGYNVISKKPNIIVPTIILLFVSYFLLNFVYGLFLIGRSVLNK